MDGCPHVHSVHSVFNHVVCIHICLCVCVKRVQMVSVLSIAMSCIYQMNSICVIALSPSLSLSLSPLLWVWPVLSFFPHAASRTRAPRPSASVTWQECFISWWGAWVWPCWWPSSSSATSPETKPSEWRWNYVNGILEEWLMRWYKNIKIPYVLFFFSSVGWKVCVLWVTHLLMKALHL